MIVKSAPETPVTSRPVKVAVNGVLSGSLTFTQNPVNAPSATLEGDRHTLPTSYQVNVAYQRDMGFNTTAEIAYVGNFTRNDRRTYNLDVLPLYVFADPNNQFNQVALSQNYLFTKFRGMGNVTDFTNDLETLRYHSLQASVQLNVSLHFNSL